MREPHEDPLETLSAYLDDEVSDAGRLKIEQYVETHASARELLTDLTRVRELVRGLSRESAPPGLRQEICARIEQGTSRVSTLQGGVGRRGWVTTGRLAIAACLVLAVSMGLYTRANNWGQRLTPASMQQAALSESEADASDLMLASSDSRRDPSDLWEVVESLDDFPLWAENQESDSLSETQLTVYVDTPRNHEMLVRRLRQHAWLVTAVEPVNEARPHWHTRDQRLVIARCCAAEARRAPFQGELFIVRGTPDDMCEVVTALQTTPYAHQARVRLAGGDGMCSEDWPGCAELKSSFQAMARGHWNEQATRSDNPSPRKTISARGEATSADHSIPGATREPTHATEDLRTLVIRLQSRPASQADAPGGAWSDADDR
jgi:hypothetical protein